MRFSAITAVFVGLCASSAFANISLDSREASEVQEYDIPAHARDFTFIDKRGKKCKVTKRSVEGLTKRATEVDMNEVGSSSTAVDVVGVNGCSGVFIWADKLYALHTPDSDFKTDVPRLKTTVGTKASSITHVAIMAPDAHDANTLKGLLTWTNKTPTIFTYPYTGSSKDIFTLSATMAKKGSVTYANDPLSKSPTPEGSSRSSSKSPSRSSSKGPKI